MYFHESSCVHAIIRFCENENVSPLRIMYIKCRFATKKLNLFYQINSKPRETHTSDKIAVLSIFKCNFDPFPLFALESRGCRNGIETGHQQGTGRG